MSRIGPIDNTGDVVTKRMSFPFLVASTGGGVIPLTSVLSGACQTIPASEWASFAARYQQYRVRCIRMRLKPGFPSTISATVPHTTFFVGDYIGASVPASAAQVLSDERSQIFGTYQTVVYEVDWTKNPNAKLWNPTSAAIPTANEYAIVFTGNGSLPATQPIFTGELEWDVEFRGSQ